MKSKTIQNFLTIGLFLGIVFLGLLEPAMAQKVHVLFVWGTRAADTQDCTNNSKTLVEEELEGIGICEPSEDMDNTDFIASFTSLSGDDASPQEILDNCRRMAQAAGPDDALFVYILCHGASTVYEAGLKPVRNNVIHILSPLALRGDEKGMALETNGLKRSDIIRAMKSSSHRLDVLITDSCSRRQAPPPKTRARSMYGDPRLVYILQNEYGTINWNSCNPFGGIDGEGETALGTIKGTLFSAAFVKVACSFVENGEDYTKEKFFNDLGAQLDKEFAEAKQKQLKEHSTDYTKYYSTQDHQTLTEFDDFGRAVFDYVRQKRYKLKEVLQ